MKNRSPIAVFLLGLITLGLYSWYWAVKTKSEMNKLGEKIPTALIWLIPFIGAVWWYWKYSEAVEHVTHKEISGVLSFVVLFLLGSIGQAIVQDFFNKIEVAPISIMAAPAASQPSGPINDILPTQPPTIMPPTPPMIGS